MGKVKAGAKPAAIDIGPDELRIVRRILKDHVPGHPVWAFGSRATGRAKPYSDLDLAVITEAPLSLATRSALAEAFSESDLPWRVDVVDWSTTAEPFRRIILRDKVVMQRRSAARRSTQSAASAG
jgi:type I restriction enzyme S subunit